MKIDFFFEDFDIIVDNYLFRANIYYYYYHHFKKQVSLLILISLASLVPDQNRIFRSGCDVSTSRMPCNSNNGITLKIK